MSDISAFYAARDFMVRALREELVGSDRDDVLTESPMNRFVAGILYPQQHLRDGSPGDEVRLSPESERQNPDSDDEGRDSMESVDTPVSLSHVRYPSAFGMSFSVADDARAVTAVVSAAQYEDKDGRWHRRPLDPTPVHIDVRGAGPRAPISVAPTLELHVVVRAPSKGAKPVTVAIVNTAPAPAQGLRDGAAWYQVELNISCADGFLDRPTHTSTGLEDADVASNRLLFRDARNLAVGHGCAVEWTDDDVVTELRMSFVPSHDVRRADTAVAGVPDLPMSVFAGGAGFDRLETLIGRYREWINDRELDAAALADEALNQTAYAHVALAKEAADRMEAGLAHLRRDPQVLRAFTLMNRAMYEQRNKQELIRNGTLESEQYWRPFQIAFILMNVTGLADPASPDRELADLLWFPTGGGKTEAYLGLIAFSILLRRIRDPRHGGVSVLMRYTLRLLTLQQFERAAGLICALEQIRQREMPTAEPISLGLWVGQAATPNDHDKARTALNKLKKGESLNENNPMQLTRCPWCGSSLRPTDYVIRQFPTPRMTIECPNLACEYHSGIPAYVIDVDVYDVRPSLVIGTVDKFAMMAWRAGAQSLFSADGKHPKPDLIVQDELHLISGPLGTMVGLYETAVDAACAQSGHRPKLIASTATIRRASSQMASVFAREARQFPPPGLDAGDSFFSREAEPDTTGTRQYVGVLAQGVTHTYLMVRTYAALLQAAADLDAPDDVRDAFWTLMGYFNSLRVLGGAAMQVTDDVPAQMQVIAKRGQTEMRELGEPKEMTSRIPSSEIPERLLELAQTYRGDPPALDVVLATNMISVGLDVDRLGLMAVMGQPQATAEYIQATSRVGRRNPGLVVVIYNSTRSRDLSHYEAFSTYHRALYRQVEPNSATPFSPRARDRGLHGALVAYARNTESNLAADSAAALLGTYPSALDPIVAAIVGRARRIAPEEADATEAQLKALVAAWVDAADTSPHLKYPGWQDGTGALLVQPETTLKSTDDLPPFPVSDAPWATLTSLRDVDAVSSFYLIPEKRTK